jgi:hypothetical protein
VSAPASAAEIACSSPSTIRSAVAQVVSSRQQRSESSPLPQAHAAARTLSLTMIMAAV